MNKSIFCLLAWTPSMTDCEKNNWSHCNSNSVNKTYWGTVPIHRLSKAGISEAEVQEKWNQNFKSFAGLLLHTKVPCNALCKRNQQNQAYQWQF